MRFPSTAETPPCHWTGHFPLFARRAAPSPCWAPRRFRPLRPEERWREVVLIAAGLAPAPRPQALVEALLAREGKAGEGLAMAGLCLAEGVRLGQDLRAEVRRRLLGRLTREEAAGPFGRLARALLAADLAAARVNLGFRVVCRPHSPLDSEPSDL